MKKCPFCAEEIQDEAIKCRFCGEFLKKKNKWIGCLFTLLAAFLIFIALILVSLLILRFLFHKIFIAFWHPPPFYFRPFTDGMEGWLKEFSEILRAFWEGLKGFLHFGPHSYKI